MSTKQKLKALAGGILLAVLLPAWGGGETTSESALGITEDTIKIGGSYPFSGPAAAYGVIGEAAAAYFEYINAQGGVEMADGKTRKIKFITYDDGYSPARLVANARHLVERDHVFAIFQTIGTPTTKAIIDYMNNREVPLVYIASGSSAWGRYEEYPWSIGWQPTIPTEAFAYASYLKKTNPDARVAILYQNDDYGEEYVVAFKRAIRGSDISIVAMESYNVTDPSVASQVTALAASGADTFFNISTPKAAAQSIKKKAQLGWEAEHVLNNISTSIEFVLKPAGLENSAGIVSAAFLKLPSDPRWADGPAVNKYKKLAKKYGDFNVNNPLAVHGWNSAASLVHALKRVEEPTREALMYSVRHMPEYTPPLALPGISVHTEVGDGFPIESWQLQRFNGTRWVLFGEPYSYEGETPVIADPELNR